MKRFHFEFLEILFATLAGVIGIVADHLGIGIAISLPVSFGFLIASSALLLKREITRHVSEKLEIYQILSKISDSDLREIGFKVLEQCKSDLKDLENGELKLEGEEFYKYIISKMDSVNKHVAAMHIALNQEGVLLWKNDPGIVKYYQANKRAINRGARIERVFILKKDLLFDSQTGQVNQATINIMKEQMNDNIFVEVKLINSIDDIKTVNEFMIYDGKEVQMNLMRSNGKYYGLRVSRNKLVLENCRQDFDKLKTSSQPLKEFLEYYERTNVQKSA